MAINLKEAAESETKGEAIKQWNPNPRSTLSDPQFAAAVGLSFGESHLLILTIIFLILSR